VGKAGGAKGMRPGPATAVTGPSKSVGRIRALDGLWVSRQGQDEAARLSDRESRRLGIIVRRPRT
jgi:hypothetical protein